VRPRQGGSSLDVCEPRHPRGICGNIARRLKSGRLPCRLSQAIGFCEFCRRRPIAGDRRASPVGLESVDHETPRKPEIAADKRIYRRLTDWRRAFGGRAKRNEDRAARRSGSFNQCRLEAPISPGRVARIAARPCRCWIRFPDPPDVPNCRHSSAGSAALRSLKRRRTTLWPPQYRSHRAERSGPAHGLSAKAPCRD